MLIDFAKSHFHQALNAIRANLLMISALLCLTMVNTVFVHAGSDSATTQSTVDRSTPTAGYQAFLAAVDRDDVAGVADSIVTSIALNGDDRTLEAERLTLGCNLYWGIESKFGRQAALDARSCAHLVTSPRIDLKNAKFENVPLFSPGPEGKVTAVCCTGSDVLNYVQMARIGDQWYDNRILAEDPFSGNIRADAPSRNIALRAALKSLRAGKISDESQLHAALVPIARDSVPTTRPTQRAVPADAK